MSVSLLNDNVIFKLYMSGLKKSEDTYSVLTDKLLRHQETLEKEDKDTDGFEVAAQHMVEACLLYNTSLYNQPTVLFIIY